MTSRPARGRIPTTSKRALYHPETTDPFAGRDRVPPLRSDAAGDDPVLGWWLASFCHLAFHPEEHARAALTPLGWQLESTLEQGGSRLMILGRAACRVVAFCGTRVDELRNVRHDADVRMTAWGDASVHRGFHLAYTTLREPLRAELARDARPLLVTGYSLGAAMAMLADGDLRPRLTVGFGVPRVGDAAFASTLDARPVYRYQNCCDAVGHLPPSLAGFRHGGTLLFITRRGRLVVRPASGWMRRHQFTAALRYTLSLRWLGADRVSVRPAADHAIGNYTARLADLAAARGS